MFCELCEQLFNDNDLVKIKDYYVCEHCKPTLIQTVNEGTADSWMIFQAERNTKERLGFWTAWFGAFVIFVMPFLDEYLVTLFTGKEHFDFDDSFTGLIYCFCIGIFVVIFGITTHYFRRKKLIKDWIRNNKLNN